MLKRFDCDGFRGRRVRFMSPHPDDAAFSAAGLLELLVANCGVELAITVAFSQSGFTADKDDDFSAVRIEEVSAVRQKEDQAYCARLAVGGNVVMEQLDLLDAPLRDYPAEEDYRSGAPFNQTDEMQVERICAHLSPRLAPETVLVSPMGIGGHVDHRIVLAAAMRLRRERGSELLLCEDMPYTTELAAAEVAATVGKIAAQYEVAVEPRLVGYSGLADVKRGAIDCYPSQVVPEQRTAILQRVEELGGERIWVVAG